MHEYYYARKEKYTFRTLNNILVPQNRLLDGSALHIYAGGVKRLTD